MKQVKRIYLIFFISQVLWASSIADFQLSHTIKAGLYQNPPMSFGDSKNPKGIFVDILNYMADKNGLSVSYKKCNFSKCLKLLKEGSIDILGPIAKNKERSKYAYFLKDSVISNWGVVYSRRGKVPNSILDIDNKTIGLLKNDIYTTAFRKLCNKFGLRDKDKLYDSYKDIFEAISKKEIDYGVANRFVYLYVKERYPDISPSTIYFNPVSTTYAINKKDKKLFALLNKELSILKEDKNSKLYLILSEYLGDNVAIRSIVSKVLWIISALVGIIFISLFVIWYFKKEVKKHTAHIQKAKNDIELLYKESKYLNNIISTAKNINQILIEPLKTDSKLDKICQELTSYHMFDFAWIGFLKNGVELELTNHSYEDKEILKNSMPMIFKDIQKAHSCKTIIIKNDKDEKSKFLKNSDLLQKIDKNIKPFLYTMLTPIKYKKGNHPIAFISVHTSNIDGFSQKEISLIEELAGDIGMMLNSDMLKKSNQKLLSEKIEDYKSFIDALVQAIEARDPYTAGHSKRVSEYVEKIAKALSYEDEKINILKRAAKIHDIGKIAVPDSILLKPGSLNTTEYNIIKKHSLTGYDILKKLNFFQEEAYIIKYHHERYDGSGYPEGLKKSEISPLVMILSIADTFDAMTTDRIYKARKTKEEAIDELLSLCGKWFEPNICKSALEVFKDINFSESSPQLPANELDEARFAYFFKDQLTGAYNYKYLDFHVYFFQYFLSLEHKITTVQLHHFSSYNEQNGWQKGNEVLTSFVEILERLFSDSKIFRIKGDDFIILHKKEFTKDDQDRLEKEFYKLGTNIELEISSAPIKYLKDEKLYRQWLYSIS